MNTDRLEALYASVSVVTTPGGTLPEQVWAGLQWSPPGVTSKGCTLPEKIWTGL